MQEATAYAWAAQCLEPLAGTSPHRQQQAADKIASAIMAAQEEGRKIERAHMCQLAWEVGSHD